MQLNEEVHNYMETLVGAALAKLEYTGKYDHEQLADLACIALNQLRPVYIRHDVDFLSSIPEEKLNQFRQQAQNALEAAETMIVDDRRQKRDDDDIPVIYKDLADEDRELEWFETPIIPVVKQPK